MSNSVELPVEEFIGLLASKSPTPGGGGAAALVGALGAALGGMVANLTMGKPKYADVEEEIHALKTAIYRVQKDLTELIDKDAEAFAPLAGAYRLPADTDAEKANKERVMQAGFKNAADAPMHMMEKCAEAIELLEEFARKGSALAISDAACGAALSAAAMRAAWLNVCVNTKFIKDEDYAARINARGKMLLEKYLPIAERTYEKVEEKLL
ncbi:MAG: cyclodeaminase/cyclohydrolase family protein [Clostridiales Family XIII bacterium]|jgi:formiminotetrahydrofolate cyclodeaminase|nr:cyclodeaminase/cyclohydrolase family protein [Clostridiales Family XIII bacterium]